MLTGGTHGLGRCVCGVLTCNNKTWSASMWPALRKLEETVSLRTPCMHAPIFDSFTPKTKPTTGHTKSVLALVTDEPSSRLYTSSADATVRAWDLTDMSCVAVIRCVGVGGELYAVQQITRDVNRSQSLPIASIKALQLGARRRTLTPRGSRA